MKMHPMEWEKMFAHLCLFIYFWPRWCVALCRLSLVAASGGCSAALHGLLITVASLVAEHGF